jgi:outer membrane protein TolC
MCRFGLGLLTLLPASAFAEPLRPNSPELPADPVLAKLLEQSLAARPELAQAGALAKAERERVPQVGTLPDPMLQLGVQNDGFTSWEIGKAETSWYSIMATQTFPWPGKLRLRSEVAALGASQADQNVARLRLSTEAEVRRAYLGLMLSRDRLGLLDRLDSLSRRAARTAKARYEAGTGAQSDLLRAQLEIKRIRQRRWALQVEANTLLQTLNRLRGHPLEESIEPGSRIAELALPRLPAEDAAYQDAQARSPELASARAGVTQGQQSVVLARKSYFPDFTVNLGVMPRGGPFPTMWLASLGIPLPVFAGSKQTRIVAESEARLVANQSNVQALEQVLRLRVEQRRTALAATLETIRLYEEGLLVESETTAESTLAQYEVGKVTFLSVLEANAGFIADQDSFLQLLAQAQSLQIDAAEVSLEPAGLPDLGAGQGGGAMQTNRRQPSRMPAPAEPGTGSSSDAGM